MPPRGVVGGLWTPLRPPRPALPHVRYFGDAASMGYTLSSAEVVRGTFRTSLTAVSSLLPQRLRQPLVSRRRNVNFNENTEMAKRSQFFVWSTRHSGDATFGRCDFREMQNYGVCCNSRTVGSRFPLLGGDVARLRGRGLTSLKPRCCSRWVAGRVSETDRDVTIGCLQFCWYRVVL
jgi:hypothetical protein